MIDIKLEKIKELLNDEQNRMYVIGALTLIAAILYSGFIIIPKVGELSKTASVSGDLTEKINVVEAKAKRIDDISAKLDGLKKEDSHYAKGLPAEKEIPGLLESLSVMAKRSGIDIQSLTPYDVLPIDGKNPQDVHYREMPLLLDAKGGFHQIGEFISNLQDANRYITVVDLRIQYDQKNPKKHNVRMMMKTYIAVENAPKKNK